MAMSALDIGKRIGDVRFVPKADSCALQQSMPAYSGRY
jgi:hypothetical protein